MSPRNVTITLDEVTARWARIEAARRDMSVSKLIAQLLREHMATEESYEGSMQDYLSYTPGPLKASGGRYPTRDELHDRAGLR